MRHCVLVLLLKLGKQAPKYSRMINTWDTHNNSRCARFFDLLSISIMIILYECRHTLTHTYSLARGAVVAAGKEHSWSVEDGLKSNFLRIMNFILVMFANHKVCNILLSCWLEVPRRKPGEDTSSNPYALHSNQGPGNSKCFWWLVLLNRQRFGYSVSRFHRESVSVLQGRREWRVLEEL